MKVKLLLIAAVLLAMTSLSFGQDFQISIWNTIPVLSGCTDGVLTGDPVAAGTQIQIWWDQNWATPSLLGPDPADIQPPVGNVLNGVSYNSFPMNPEDAGFEGGFYTMVAWLSSQNVPSNPHYYLKIVLPGVTLWSDDYLAQAGAGDWDADVWHCIVTGPPPCTGATASWDWPYTGHAPQTGLGFANCAKLCVNHGALTFTITVSTGGHADPVRVPVVTVAAGCADCGDPQAVAGSFAPMAPPVVTVNPTNIVYTYTITPLSDGYVCVKFDAILAATITNVAIVPSDNSVKVSWTSVSETNLSKYQIVRDGAPIANIAAEGGATNHDYSYTDGSALNGHAYTYVIRSVNLDGTYNDQATASVSPSVDKLIVTEYALHQNYPNPFNPTTSIRFDLVDRNFVTLKIYNATGQEVATVVNRECKAGVNVVNFDASNLTSGLYFYTVKIGNEFSATKKMLLLK